MLNELLQLTRRGLLGKVTTGLSGVALTHLLSGSVHGKTNPWTSGQGETHFAPKAKRVLQIFCPGAASHMDLWEHKPSLEKWHGKPLPGEENMVSFQGKNGNLMQSPWPFARRGESGKAITSMLPQMAEHVDDIAFIHSMTSKSNTHGPVASS